MCYHAQNTLSTTSYNIISRTSKAKCCYDRVPSAPIGYGACYSTEICISPSYHLGADLGPLKFVKQDLSVEDWNWSLFFHKIYRYCAISNRIFPKLHQQKFRLDPLSEMLTVHRPQIWNPGPALAFAAILGAFRVSNIYSSIDCDKLCRSFCVMTLHDMYVKLPIDRFSSLR